MSLVARLAVVAGLAVAVAGCHKVQARTPAPMPSAPPAPLDTPEPPGRLIYPQPLPEPQPAETPAAPNPRDTQRQPSRPPASASTPPPASSTNPPQTEPPPVVQTSQNATALEQQARRQLASANSDLSAVDYGSLSSSGRATYEEVRRFIRQVEEQLKVKNFVLAAELANKAALLASQLKR